MLMDSRFQFRTHHTKNGRSEHTAMHSYNLYAMKQSVYLIVREEVTREALREVLRSVGIEPVIVGRELDEIRGRNVARNNGSSLAVLDVGIPNGWDFSLYEELQEMEPNLKVLVTTSYDKQEIEHLFPQDKTFSVLYKPYGAQTFISVVRSILKH